MSSLLTNSAALAALQTLRTIDNNLNTTQERISSGFKVGNAADNAAYWSIATTMRSDHGALSTTVDALGLGSAKTDTAYAGLDQVRSLLDKIKSKLVAASQPGVDKEKVSAEVEELKKQIFSVTLSSSFSGENWVYNSDSDTMPVKQLVGSFTRSDSGSTSIQTIDYDASQSILIDIGDVQRGVLTMDTEVTDPDGTTTNDFFLIDPGAATGANGNEIKLTSATSADDLRRMRDAVEIMLAKVIDSASTLGAIKTRIDSQSDFVKNLVSTIEKGVGRLVDADMNEESTRLKALQTQQQLGIQALSIANTNAQNILQLFK
ncbi:flagellin N-terminal helical domain-containing protein [Gellertiella hungarica]|uniref:Flagellin n=1 Tax=Gellertiella hungarica TaxID=1572859 RepID=A0A7W6J4W3_9HYPH|nr:flagellin [Gellertiella hungarica]MBB4064127.1 flagellin [Gellertiella hungarica]